MKNYNKYCNKNKRAWIAYCNNIRSKLMHGFETGYNSAFGCVKRFTLKFCCIKMKSLLPTLIHHGHTLKSSLCHSYVACATDKTKFWLSLSCFGPPPVYQDLSMHHDWLSSYKCHCQFAYQDERKFKMHFW